MKNIMLEELLTGQVLMPYFHFIGPPLNELEDSLDNKKPYFLSVTEIHRFVGNQAEIKKVMKILTVQTIRYEEPEEDYGRFVILGKIINDAGDDEIYPHIEIALTPERAREGYFIFENASVTFFQDNDPDDWWRH